MKMCVAPRDVVIVQGDDAAVFLHSQLAQDISSLAVGAAVHSFLLEPTGHVVAIARVFRHVDSVFTLDVDAGLGDAVVTRLQKFVLRAKVTMRTSDWAVRTHWGTGVRDALAETLGSTPAWWGTTEAVDVIRPPDEVSVHGHEATIDEWHRARTDAQWPFVGRDVEVGDIPAATGVVRVSASFTKGCYPGQELVERMDSRGSAAPASVRACPAGAHRIGDHVRHNGDIVATITSVGDHVALARVKRGTDFGVELGTLHVAHDK